MRPDELAGELGISGKTLGGWLRRGWPQSEDERGHDWILTPEQVSAARSRWGSKVWKPAWEPGREPYHVERLASWDEYRSWVDRRLVNWIFRGQRDESWPLWSSLSRRMRSLRIVSSLWPEQERRILRVFKRKAHLYLDHVPDERDEFQWLALMQHHGAPTRLLDMTWSPYTAAFFALQDAESDAAVWCVHHNATQGSAVPGITPTDEDGLPIEYLDQAGKPRIGPTPSDLSPKWTPGGNTDDLLRRRQANFHDFFVEGTVPFIYRGEPHVMNQRLIAQNATFVMPSRIDMPVDEILGHRDEWARGLVKLVLPRELRREAMSELYSMNVTNAALFPDLDGLARSMAQELEYHWAVEPHTGERLERLDDPRAGWDASQPSE